MPRISVSPMESSARSMRSRLQSQAKRGWRASSVSSEKSASAALASSCAFPAARAMAETLARCGASASSRASVSSGQPGRGCTSTPPAPTTCPPSTMTPRASSDGVCSEAVR